MSKVWVGVALAAFAIGGGTAYLVVRHRAPDLGPSGPNRDLAPESLAVYAELPDLAGTWAKMSKTEAWQDFSVSKAAEQLLATELVKDVLAALDQVSAKASYPLNSKNAMKFIGRECSVGIALDPAGGAPKVLVLTKLDVEALSRDFLGGKVNLEALWGELQRRTGKCDFTVTATEYKGHTIAQASRDSSSFHAALVGDTLAVSTDEALVKSAIDCRLAQGAHSLGRKAAFAADVKALPAGTACFEWYDLDALESARNSLDAGLRALGTPPAGLAAVHSVLEGTKGAHSVALSQVVPDGDLYRATWSYSKSDDLFADKAAPPLRSLYAGDWLAYGELHDVGGVVDAFQRSALKKKLAAGELGKWIDKVTDDPAPAVGKLVGAFADAGRAARPAPVRRRPGARAPATSAPPPAPPSGPEPPADGTAKAVDEGLAMVDRFAARMGRHFATEQLKALVNGEVAAGIDWSGKDGELPRFAFTVRLDVEGRLLALALEGAALELKHEGIAFEQVGARRVFAADVPGGTKLWWVLAGDAFVVTDDHDLAIAAAHAGDGPAPAPPKRMADAVSLMKVGWRAFLHVDYDRLLQALGSASETNGAMRSFKEFLDKYRDPGLLGHDAAVAAYVPDDFSSIEVRSRVTLAEPKTDDARAFRKAVEAREPRCWASLPDTTFLNFVTSVPVVWLSAKAFAGAEMPDAEAKFLEKMGMDLEKDLLPALGRELSFSVTYRQAPPPRPADQGGPAVFLPGLVFGVEVHDAAVVRKAVDRALEIAEEGLKNDPNYASVKPFSREAHDGVEIVRMEIPPAQQESVPFRPALALQDDYLLVSSDVDVLRAAVDARNGKGKRFADSPVLGRAAAVLGRKGWDYEFLDGSRFIDQIGEYAPHMGRLFVDVTPPDYPPNGDQAEWKRRLDAYQKEMAAAQASGGEKAKAWIESFRVVDFAGLAAHVEGNVSESTMVVRFSE
jgi:hypothetical protein